MATMLGSLLVSLGLESAQFKRGSREAEKSMQTLSQRMQQVGSSMQSIGARMSVAVTAPLAIFGKTAFDAGVQAREAFAQVEQALSTMGDASGKTAGQLKSSAQELATFSNFNRTDILGKVTAQLLTFGNVSGDVFDRAQQAAVDLSARLGQDLQSSAIQLGKALNDPIKGITALSRVGVAFTEDQKALIKSLSESGDVAAAQGIILEELEKQYGGAAKAARDAAPGGDQTQAWRELQEAVGDRLLDAFAKLEQVVAPVIRAFLNMPEGVQTAAVVVAALAAAAGPLLVVFGSFVALAPAIAAGFAAVSAAALPIAAVVAAVAAAGYLIYQNWDQIAPVLDSVAKGFRDAIGPGLQKIIDDVSAKLTELWEGPLGEMLRTAISALMDFQAGYVSVLGEGLIRVLNAAISVVGGAFNSILGVFTAVSRFLKGDFAGAWEALRGVASSVVSAIAGAIEALFPGLIQMGKDIIRGIVDGIRAAPGAVRDALLSVIKSGVDTAKAFLGIKSPSRLFMAIGHNVAVGLAIGIRDGEGIVSDAMKGLAKEAGTAANALQSLYDRLFPYQAQTRKFAEDMALIQNSRLSDAEKELAISRLEREAFDNRTSGLGKARVSRKLLDEGPLVDFGKQFDELTRELESGADKARGQTVRIAQSFADMTRSITSSLQGLTNSIRSGDFLGILGGVLDVFTTLGSAGVFGSGLQGRLNRVPGNANGTRNFGGGLSVVGERGPELVNLPRRSQVIPNHKLNGMGGGGIAQIVPSPYFDVVVDGRVMRAAPMVANAGAMQAQSMGARSARRTVRR